MPRKPPKGTPFEPGQSGNPSGRPALPKALREAKKMSRPAFEAHVARLTAMSPAELKQYIESGKATMLEVMIAGQIQAATKGKTTPFAFLLDRTIGPVKQQMKLEVDGTVSQELADMTEEQKDALLQQLEDRIGTPAK